MNGSRVRWVSVVVILGAGGLSACASVGEKEFSCPGRPSGVRCMTATEVYRATETTDVVEPTAAHALGDEPEPERTKGRQRSPRESERLHRTTDHRDTMPEAPRAVVAAVDKPIPVRTPAQVMRVWIAPWEDTAGILHAGGYAFIELEARRWTFGESSSAIEPARFFSLQESSGELKGAVGKDQGASSTRPGTSEHLRPTPSSTLPNQGAPR